MEERTMAGLTVTEKEFWKTRIAARIEKHVEAIKSRHPALHERVKRESHTQALESLGLTESYRELESLKCDEAALARRRERVQRTMIAVLHGVPLEEVSDSLNISYGIELPLPLEAHEAMARRQRAHQEQLLAADPVGQEITRLDAERERLLDVVWLATSPVQNRTLWSKVGALLGDETTQLEREAPELEPAKEG
jgi:hypothetical protein